LHDGQVVSGIDAFLIIWRQMPRYRPVAWVVGLPVIRHAAYVVHEAILAPVLYRAHLRRVARRAQ
jgi:hypothetical protein